MACLNELYALYEKLLARIENYADKQPIKNQFIKIKFSNFRQTSAEVATHEIKFDVFKAMFLDSYPMINLPIRLLGVRVHFTETKKATHFQQSLF